MLRKIRCNPMHLFYRALTRPYVPVRVTSGALVAYRYTYAPPRRRTLQYHTTFIPLSLSHFCGMILSPYSMMWDWWLLIAGPCLLIGLAASSSFVSSPYLLVFYGLVLWAGEFVLIGWLSLSPSLALPTVFNNNNDNIIIIITLGRHGLFWWNFVYSQR